MAMDFDDSVVFWHVYEQYFGRFGGEPFGVIVADYEFGSDVDSVDLLRQMSRVCGASHAIFLAAGSPSLLGLSSWARLHDGVDASILSSSENRGWMSLRRSPDSRYVGLVVPRVLLRRPYAAMAPGHAWPLREDAFARHGRNLLWGNGAFALAARMIAAFHEYRWCTAIRGLDGGGVIEGLPCPEFATDRGAYTRIPPVEVCITEAVEKNLTEHGLIPICRSADNALSFFGLPSLHVPPEDVDSSTRASFRLSAELPYLLAASRIAHYLKVMMRRKVASFQDRQELVDELSAWLSKHTLAHDSMSKEKQRERPLREFAIDIQERAGRPGEFEAVVYLTPHYQLEEADVRMRLVIDLSRGHPSDPSIPPGGAA